jgi:elongation factor G
MGELHLEIYVERLKREWSIDCITSRPRVAFRETITKLADFNYTHKKQTGGAGQFGRVMGYVEPAVKEVEAADLGESASDEVVQKKPDENLFENRVMSGNVPIQYIPGVEKVWFYLSSYSPFYRKLCLFVGIPGSSAQRFTYW